MTEKENPQAEEARSKTTYLFDSLTEEDRFFLKSYFQQENARIRQQALAIRDAFGDIARDNANEVYHLADQIEEVLEKDGTTLLQALAEGVKDGAVIPGSALADAIPKARMLREKREAAQLAMNSLYEHQDDEGAAIDIFEYSNEIGVILSERAYKGKTLFDALATGIDLETGKIIPGSTLEKVYALAQERRRKSGLPAVKGKQKHIDMMDYITEEVGREIWNITGKDVEKTGKGVISFDVASKKDKRKGISINTFLAIDFSQLKDVSISEELRPIDNLIHNAAATFYRLGIHTFTLPQIYYGIGYTGKKPGKKDSNKLLDEFSRLRKTEITIDNKEESEVYNYPYYKYTGALLPSEAVTIVVNGVETTAIHLLREPPLAEFARQRGQITPIKIECLQAPKSKTDFNLRIQNYLISAIAHQKHKKPQGGSANMLYETIYEHTGIVQSPTSEKEKDDKAKAPGVIKDYLQQFVSADLISSFEESEDKIKITWPKTNAEQPRRRKKR